MAPIIIAAGEIAGRIERVESGLQPGCDIAGCPSAGFHIGERMARYRVPGVSIAVINRGEIEWAKGYGVLQAGTAEPVDTHTLFQAASISKPVAALAALRLVDEGLLELDGDVNRWLRGWQVPDSKFLAGRSASGAVTLRGLLSHYAGTTIGGFPGYRAGSALPSLIQVLDGLPPANTGPVIVDIPPGTEARYSGGGYCIVQQLCGDVSGLPFPEFMQQSVLRPLGMAASAYEQPLAADRGRNAARGHGVDGVPVAGGAHIYPELAAAGLWTTPSDVARFALAVQRAYAASGPDRPAAPPPFALSAGLVRDWLVYQWKESLPSKHPIQPANAGLGLFLAQSPRALYFGHTGSNAGYRCAFTATRDGGQGAVVMTNGDLGWLLRDEILFAIAQEYGWPDFAPILRTVADVDPALYPDYAGDYVLEPGELFRVAADGKRLAAQPSWFGGLEVELYPAAESEFFLAELPARLTFARDEDGRVTHLLFNGQRADKVA